MITGDSQETAKAIGKHLGLISEPVPPNALFAGSHFQSLSLPEQVSFFFFLFSFFFFLFSFFFHPMISAW